MCFFAFSRLLCHYAIIVTFTLILVRRFTPFSLLRCRYAYDPCFAACCLLLLAAVTILRHDAFKCRCRFSLDVAITFRHCRCFAAIAVDITSMPLRYLCRHVTLIIIYAYAMIITLMPAPCAFSLRHAYYIMLTPYYDAVRCLAAAVSMLADKIYLPRRCHADFAC